MEVTIEEAIENMKAIQDYYNDKTIKSYLGFAKDDNESVDMAISIMRKYQKIKEQVDIAIDKENFAISNARLIQIRGIINGNVD